ncbi:MAG: chorismate mutase [Hyphomicrobiales bacterium]|nr:chorismate mutase [Hyphomicrobiales bacterium]
MTNSPADSAAASLAALRQNIDRIDESIHRLLMERGEIIENLIATKAKQGGGSAFRPGREAEMMRRLVQRHGGLLPLDTVESIWRIIIGTFTYVQANYAIHVDVSAGDAAMRDSARFHFGFSPPYVPHHGPHAVIDAVARSGGDLGLVRVVSAVGDGAWWSKLTEPTAPKVIARLPFVDRPDHPAGIPLYVVSKPLAEAAALDVQLFAVRIDRWNDALPAAVRACGGALVGNAANDYGLSLLLSFPGPSGVDNAVQALKAAGMDNVAPALVGSHAEPFSTQSANRNV